MATYTLEIFNFDITIPINSKLKFILPSEYDIRDFKQGRDYTGNMEYCASACDNTIVWYEGAVFTIEGMFTTEDMLIFGYTINNIPNPRSTGVVSDYSILIIDPNGSQVYSTQITGQTFVPAHFTCSISTPSPPTISNPSTITFLLSPLLTETTLTSIEIRFPSTWPSSPISSPTLPLTGTLSCESVSHPSIQCVKFSTTIYINNLAGLTNSTNMDITINSIINPNLKDETTVIEVSILNSQGKEMQTCSSPINGLVSNTFTSTSISVSYTSNTELSITLLFSSSFNLPENTTLEVTLPPHIMISPPASPTLSLSDNLAEIPITIAYDLATNTLKITLINFLIKPSLNLTVNNIPKFKSNKVIENTKISASVNGKVFIESFCCGEIIKATNTLQVGAEINGQGQTVLEVSGKQEFSENSIIYVYFPIEYALEIGPANCIVLLPTSSPAICKIIRSNILEISEFVSSLNPSPKTNFTFSFPSLPSPLTSPSLPLITLSLDSNMNIVELNNEQMIQISSETLEDLSVESSSPTVWDIGINILIKWKKRASSTEGGSVDLWLPKEITVKDNFFCSIPTLPPTLCPCIYTLAEHKISVELSFLNIETIILSELINPISSEFTESFEIKMYDDNKNVLGRYGKNNGNAGKLRVLQFGNFKDAQVIVLNGGVFQLSTLEILIITPSVLTQTPATLTFTILYPSTFLPYSPKCTKLLPQTQLLSCSASSLSLSFTLQLIFATDSFYFQIENILLLDTKIPIQIEMSINGSMSLSTTTVIGGMNIGELTYSVWQSEMEVDGTDEIKIDYAISRVDDEYLEFVQPSIMYVTVNIPPEFTTTFTGNEYNHTLSSSSIYLPSIKNPSLPFPTSYFSLSAYSVNHNLVAISIVNYQYEAYCLYPCRTCTIPTFCTSCYTTAETNIIEMETGKCVGIDGCSIGYYVEIDKSGGIFDGFRKCNKCMSGCKECLDEATCLVCDDGMFLGELEKKCFTECPDGFYEEQKSKFCISCPSTCFTCSSYLICTSCYSPYSLHNNTCLREESCPPKEFLSNIHGTCLPCTPNCLTCSESACMICEYPYYLNNNTCQLSCGINLYKSLSGICEECECNECEEFSHICTSCKLPEIYFHNSFCFGSCPDGTFPSPLSNSIFCIECENNCLLCSINNICQKCKENFYLKSGHCVNKNECTSSSLQTLNEGIQLCEMCSHNCLTCELTKEYCTSCQPNFFFHDNICVQSCPFPLLPSLSNTCLLCPNNCLTCAQEICLTCYQLFYLSSNECVLECPARSSPNILTRECEMCQTGCQTCYESKCTSCILEYYLFNHLCFSNCSQIASNYYMNTLNKICSTCEEQCLSCIEYSHHCTACSFETYYYNPLTFECTPSCKEPYYPSSENEISTSTNFSIVKNICVKCQSNCLTCLHNYFTCTDCIQGYFLSKSTCVLECGEGFYPNEVNECVSCGIACEQCGESGCLLCDQHTYLDEGSCVIECPEERKYRFNGYCTNCQIGKFCKNCENSSLCTECYFPYILFYGECVNSCPNTYTIITQNSIRVCSENEGEDKLEREDLELNKPILPPFLFLTLNLVAIAATAIMTEKLYNFTYHIGYIISYFTFFCCLLQYYYLYFIISISTFSYFSLETVLIIGSLLFNSILISLIFLFYVINQVYLKDIRYVEWRNANIKYWWVFICLAPFFGGHRLHKINYSKMFELSKFSFRIVSVEKFYREDILTWLTFFGDILHIIAAIIIINKTEISYNSFIFIGYESIISKIFLWLSLLTDLKKPDRGFFQGDEEEAKEQILKEEEEFERMMNRVDTENLVKLVRTNSSAQILDKEFDFQIEDFKSVYNPEEYEDVPKVSVHKIEKSIYKGKFKKGKKITMEEKLRRFADKIKPNKIKKPVNSYWNGLVYWKPPEYIKKSPKTFLPQSEESMFNLLSQKEIEYKEELESIEILEKEEKGNRYNPKLTHNRNDYHAFLVDLDETIPQEAQEQQEPSETIEFFYPSKSVLSKENSISVDFDDMMNLNYARKKHLKKEVEKVKKEVPNKKNKKKRKYLGGANEQTLDAYR